MTAFQVQALITFIAPFLIQAAKASQVKILAFVSENNKVTSVIISFVTAVGTNMGLHLTHPAAGQLMFTYPSLPVAIQGLTGFLVMTVVQFLAQGSIYDQIARFILPTKQGEKQAAAIQSLGGAKA